MRRGKPSLCFWRQGVALGSRTRVARQLPDPLDFDAVWVVGLQEVTAAGDYSYAATRLDLELVNAPAWRVRVSPDFESWVVTRIQ